MILKGVGFCSPSLKSARERNTLITNYLEKDGLVIKAPRKCNQKMWVLPQTSSCDDDAGKVAYSPAVPQFPLCKMGVIILSLIEFSF